MEITDNKPSNEMIKMKNQNIYQRKKFKKEIRKWLKKYYQWINVHGILFQQL